MEDNKHNKNIIEDNMYDSDSDEDLVSHKYQQKIALTDKFKESIIKYLHCDSHISEKMTDIKKLKDEKKKYEKIIIDTLETMNESNITAGNTVLIKSTVESKSAIKPEMLKEVIKNEFKSRNLVQDEKRCETITEEILQKVDEKRNKKVKTVLRKKKNKA
jgi:hypothetical protein